MGAEKVFENELKAWLATEGVYPLGTPREAMEEPPCGYWEKRWGGGPYVRAGMPDMHIVVNGISFEVELKAPNGVVSDLQKQKLRQIQQAGSYAMVCRPSDFEIFKGTIRHMKCIRFEY